VSAIALLAGWLVFGISLTAAAPATYCTGQRTTDEAGAPYYPNGQRVVDGFGKEYYPNGARLTNDYGDEIRYSNGGRVRSASGDVLFPNGTAVKSASGQVRYPNGQQARSSTGTCYFETGVEMQPCQRVVSMRERLAGGETVFYEVDLVGGTIDHRAVRYEFPAEVAVITLTADLASGRLDRGSISAVCPSGSR
jgi:hypothetical protein